ncbi:uncharacterized protein PAC_03808 [Phialocephala subalpina]|uniref:Chromosome transmission fidelity protein 4 n=1 Tax=Phialocephala subalpina TaxID=576137 RepID=A0A1L7WMF5_9HELO|nr:uncharacterized protein PAC_03808 [Phialocephala subalpina]
MSTASSLVRSTRHVSKLSPTLSSRGAQGVHLQRYSAQAPSRSLATINPGQKALPDVWFAGSTPLSIQLTTDGGPGKPDERTLNLGKTLRVLQERMPTLLQSPLPQEILSPQITLHLFPSTHPHLPTVSGRVAYSAALWTSPIAWGRVPIVGNVKLKILSERMIKSTLSGSARPEQLVVRWKTIGKTKGKGTGAFYKGIGGNEHVDKITEFLGGGKGEDDSKEFTGLFIFEFDEEGRVVSHTIEHVQEGGNWEKCVGARVVGLTDWLLGGMRRNGRDEGSPCPAFWVDERDHQMRR